MKKLFALAAIAIAVGAHAQDFPGGKSITIVVPFAAGGPTDRVARDLAEALRKPLGGGTVIIDNVPGAGSSIGAANLPFKVETDFEYLGIVNDVPMTLISKPSIPATNYKELTTWIASNKGKINIGNAGVGSASHLCGLLYQSATKTEMTAVPYKGTAPAITDLIGGQIDLLCDQTTNTTPQIQAGKVKAFAVTTPKRLALPMLKDLPTLDEAGLKNFQVTIWHGLYAPKGTPAAVVNKLNAALNAVTRKAEYRKLMEAQGTELATLSPEETTRFVVDDAQRTKDLIKSANLKLE